MTETKVYIKKRGEKVFYRYPQSTIHNCNVVYNPRFKDHAQNSNLFHAPIDNLKLPCCIRPPPQTQIKIKLIKDVP